MATPLSPRSGSARAGRVRRQPQRTCVACRDTSDKRTLTRLVRAPDGHVHLDRTGRANGRGAYLCDRAQCWERALGRADVLGRALKAMLSPEDRAAIREGAPALVEDERPDEHTHAHIETNAHERAGEDA
ncbi:MAG: YlxR family protein [Dehalococcoidia bacterium]